MCLPLQPKASPRPIRSLPSRPTTMIVTPADAAEQALICRAIAGIRRILGRSVPIQIRTIDGRLVDADDLEALLAAAAEQRVRVRRHPVVVQGPDHARQVQQLDGKVVHAVGLQAGDHRLQPGNPPLIP